MTITPDIDPMALPLRERLIHTAESVFRDIQTVPEDGFTARAPECIFRALPASIGIPPMDNEEILALHRKTRSSTVMKNFQARRVPGSVPIVDEAQRKIVFHMQISADMSGGKFEQEYIFIMTANETGTLLTHIDEFMDSYLYHCLKANTAAAGERDE
ncbi:uncharacterized protein BDV14DRAFT_198801 [Aspergillus stella-maris]|uniref:uncharacterized protein n=1 Tax=Aspergillus stella-maris TaxID=1810926 RepID=UPI003CCD80D4